MLSSKLRLLISQSIGLSILSILTLLRSRIAGKRDQLSEPHKLSKRSCYDVSSLNRVTFFRKADIEAH